MESIDYERLVWLNQFNWCKKKIWKKVNEIEGFPEKVNEIEGFPEKFSEIEGFTKKVNISIELIDWFD